MWRRNAPRAQENQDSDQSISDEGEGLEGDWTRTAICLGGAGDSKGGMQVLSQLEILRESYELRSAEDKCSLDERKEGYHIDDEVENPLFFDGDSSVCCPRIADATHNQNKGIVLPTASISHFDEELISDDEDINTPALRSANENVGSTWPEASREVEALFQLNENASCSLSHDVFMKQIKSSKGGSNRTKAKHKFLFRLSSRRKDLSFVVTDEKGGTSSENFPLSDEIGAAADNDMDKFMAESQLVFNKKESKQPERDIVPSQLGHKHDLKEASVAEFLDCFQERTDLLQGSSELEIKERGRRMKMISKRNVSPSSDENLDDDDLPEALDSYNADEKNPQSPKSNIQRTSMVDHFHETFGVASVIDERPHFTFPRSLCGLYQKLQQVVQSEKERDMDYLKNTSAETSFKDERMCISVRILSRSLEAKLIVCSCTSIGDRKKSHSENDLQMRMKGVLTPLTIIFNPRICSDVELEVGNLIFIHPPWKEVHVKGKDEVVLLCSYYSQLHP